MLIQYSLYIRVCHFHDSGISVRALLTSYKSYQGFVMVTHSEAVTLAQL